MHDDDDCLITTRSTTRRSCFGSVALATINTSTVSDEQDSVSNDVAFSSVGRAEVTRS